MPCILYAISRTHKRNDKPEFIKYLRGMFAVRFAHGFLLCSFPCGVVAGIAPLWESEGDAMTCLALNDIWRHKQHTPDIMYYDRGCSRRRYLINHPSDRWENTIMLIDRCLSLCCVKARALRCKPSVSCLGVPLLSEIPCAPRRKLLRGCKCSVVR